MILLKKSVSMNRMKEILSTVNTRVVKEVVIKPGSSHSPNRMDWCDIIIGGAVYSVFLGDQDSEIADYMAEEFKKMLKEFDLPYVLRPNPYIYQQQTSPFKARRLSLSDICPADGKGSVRGE